MAVLDARGRFRPDGGCDLHGRGVAKVVPR